MTQKKSTVLILGAGSSHGYGFPVGSQLRKMILALRDNQTASNFMGYGQATIRRFIDDFRASQSASIDAFLGRRQDFLEVGKAAIAYVLLGCEEKADLTSDDNPDHWYQYLLNNLATDSWDNFDPSWLSIVTFNYDRSLPHYLATSLAHTYKKSREDVLEKLRDLKMVHVYGRLGDPFTQIPFGVPLDEDTGNRYVSAAAKQLLIIPEGRDDSPNVTEAQKLINDAKRVCFLGFGFDAINIRRLGAPGSFLMGGGPYQPKHTIATSLDVTNAECMKAIRGIFGSNIFNAEDLRTRFYAGNCLHALRESLVLD